MDMIVYNGCNKTSLYLNIYYDFWSIYVYVDVVLNEPVYTVYLIYIIWMLVYLFSCVVCYFLCFFFILSKKKIILF